MVKPEIGTYWLYKDEFGNQDGKLVMITDIPEKWQHVEWARTSDRVWANHLEDDACYWTDLSTVIKYWTPVSKQAAEVLFRPSKK